MQDSELFNDTVTIFHLYEGVWYPFSVNDCELQGTLGIREKNSGALSSDRALLMLPITDGSISGMEYITPESFTGQLGVITFANGDLFVKGEYTDAVRDDDYIDGYYSHMNERSVECFLITSIKRFKLIPHFEIGGA